jgi:hypothetical protein
VVRQANRKSIEPSHLWPNKIWPEGRDFTRYSLEEPTKSCNVEAIIMANISCFCFMDCLCFAFRTAVHIRFTFSLSGPWNWWRTRLWPLTFCCPFRAMALFVAVTKSDSSWSGSSAPSLPLFLPSGERCDQSGIEILISRYLWAFFHPLQSVIRLRSARWSFHPWLSQHRFPVSFVRAIGGR